MGTHSLIGIDHHHTVVICKPVNTLCACHHRLRVPGKVHSHDPVRGRHARVVGNSGVVLTRMVGDLVAASTVLLGRLLDVPRGPRRPFGACAGLTPGRRARKTRTFTRGPFPRPGHRRQNVLVSDAPSQRGLAELACPRPRDVELGDGCPGCAGRIIKPEASDEPLFAA